MHDGNAKSRSIHTNLDTAYVNLAALVRYLRQRDFTGRIRVELDEYEADIFLNTGSAPRVRETDHTTGRIAEGDAALQRLLVRAREAGGLISVYEGAGEEVEGEARPAATASQELLVTDAETHSSTEESEWRDLLRLSGELIAAVEHAAASVGADFDKAFRAARAEMADDYLFLDPSTGDFEYADKEVRLDTNLTAHTYVTGLSECLRRAVNHLATGARANSLREQVALEFAWLSRRRQTQMQRFKFTSYLGRIAGAKVL